MQLSSAIFDFYLFYDGAVDLITVYTLSYPGDR